MSYIPDTMRKRIYDKDNNQKIDIDAIPDLPRSKITDFFSEPFWENIPDKKINVARVIATEDTPEDLKKLADIICQRNPVFITDCEEPWTSENANVTCTTSTDCVEGNYSAEIDVSSDCTGTVALASYSPPSPLDLSNKDGISLWMKIINGSSYKIDSGYLQLKIYNSTENELATYDIPTGLINNNETMDWREFEFVFDDPSNFTDVAKIELYKNKYLARDFKVFIDLVRALEWKDQDVIAQEMENLKSQGGGEILLLPGTYKMTAPITNSTQGDFRVKIDGYHKTAILKQLKGGDYFNLKNARYITLKELRCVGGDRIYIDNAHNLTIINCEIEGVVFGDANNMRILFSTFVSTTSTTFYFGASDNVLFVGNYIDVRQFDLHEGCDNAKFIGNTFVIDTECRLGWNRGGVFVGNEIRGTGKLKVGFTEDSVVCGNRCTTLIVDHPGKGYGKNVKIVGNQFDNYDLSNAGHLIEIDFGEGYNFFKYNMAVYG